MDVPGQARLINVPPPYCQYAGGVCDQSFDEIEPRDAFFVYPSEPRFISATIEEAIRKIKGTATNLNVVSWKQIGISGQLVFCRICQHERFATVVVPDVSRLNLNVLFEIGYALGLNGVVLPVRDTSIVTDKKYFDELGLLDTFGYIDFENSDDLATKLPGAIAAARPIVFQDHQLNTEAPLYVIKAPRASDGQVKLLSGIKKSGLRFRTFDPKETTRLSLQEAFRQVRASFGVAAHMMSPERAGAVVHNARAAFLCGMAMAFGKHVLMLQEGEVVHPIDYRDVVKGYKDPGEVQALLGPFIQPLYEAFQTTRFVPITLPLRPLETLDFGDVAAENEINALRSYFVPTAEYQDVRRGHARLVVGRKGTGKSAIFYGVRNALWSSQSNLVLDLKPEGHQFTKLRELLLRRLSPGVQEHVLTAFWNYILLMEIANKIVDADADRVKRRGDRLQLYSEIKTLAGWNPAVEQGDFSERLLDLVDRLIARSANIGDISHSAQVTNLIYSTDVATLGHKLAEYLQPRDGVWLLFDNLDKGWPVNGATDIDILILRSLFEATRKIQRQLERKKVECHAVVFIRNDIYEHLLRAIPDKGKDTAVTLQWTDSESFKTLIRHRIAVSTGYQESFEQLWATFFESHVDGEESFQYLLNRTMMRPRDLLMILRECVNVAVNRGHGKVTAADISYAEKAYSADQLQEVSSELKDVAAELPDILYAFIGCDGVLSEKEVLDRVSTFALLRPDVLELLLWFGFLGIVDVNGDERYAYQFHYGVKRLLQDAAKPARYVIHPAFRAELGCGPGVV
jgi:hypothetical protein